MDATDAVHDFLILSESYLRALTFGVDHVKQAFSYVCEHFDEEGGYGIFVGKAVPKIIQRKKQSRHLSSQSYFLWIKFDAEDEDDLIKFWYYSVSRGLV